MIKTSAFVRISAVLLAAFPVVSCTTTPYVTTKVSDGFERNLYKTFKIVRFNLGSENERAQRTPTTGVDKALMADVSAVLQERGLKPSDTNPDLTFNYTALRRQGHAGERDWPYSEGAVNLIATDTRGQTVWNAHLEAVLDPHDKVYHQLKEAILKAFKDYPTLR